MLVDGTTEQYSNKMNWYQLVLTWVAEEGVIHVTHVGDQVQVQVWCQRTGTDSASTLSTLTISFIWHYLS